MPRIKQTEIATIEEALNTGNGAGYVLDFSNRTFTLFFEEEFGIYIDLPNYRIEGGSKDKRLRGFLTIEDGQTAAHVLRALWDHRAAILARRGEVDTPGMAERYFVIVHRLQGDPSAPSTDAIERFASDGNS